MNYTNGGYFCMNCAIYVPKEESTAHDQFCKGSGQPRVNQNVTEFNYRDSSLKGEQGKAEDYYNLSDAMITFGKTSAFSQAIDTPEGFDPLKGKPINLANNSFKKNQNKNIDKPLQITAVSSLKPASHKSDHFLEETEKILKEER